MRKFVYYLIIGIFAIILLNPVYAQETINPSLILYEEEIQYYEFNRVARDASITEFDKVHSISWQIILDNNLVYENPDGSTSTG